MSVKLSFLKLKIATLIMVLVFSVIPYESNWSGNRQMANPGPASLGYFYSDMVSGTKKVCARGWVYTSKIPNYVTSTSVYRSWACNDPGA